MAMAKRGLVDRVEKPPRGVGSEPGDRQDWQRISGKMRRKSMPVLSVPGALVGGDEVSMAVFHELSRAEGPWSFYIFNPRLRLDAEFFASGQSCACAVRIPVRGARK